MPSATLVTTLELNANSDLPDELAARCDRASALGYHLAAAFPHLDRLVLVFQVHEENNDTEGNL